MKISNKLFKILVSFLIIAFVFFLVQDKVSYKNKKEAKAQVSLRQEGCLGLNYHRVRENSFMKKTIEALTISDELMYYSVYEDEFEQHIKILLDNNVQFLSPKDLRKYRENGNYPQNSVWISFDDVDISVYENAFPILEKYQVPFTLFLIAGQVGNNDFQNLDLANWEQIQEMVDSGLVTVGSHTYNMHSLKDNKPVFFDPEEKEAFLQDLIKSKETIESKLKNVEVVDFAYPYGEGKNELVPLIKEAGFLNACILYQDTIAEGDDPYWQNRLLVHHESFKKIVVPWLKN